jgi:DNA helicase-2/ATP-dependent DNA helicase PcrA
MDELDQYFFISRTKNWSQILNSIQIKPDLEGHQRINEIFNSYGGSKHRAVINCISFFNRVTEEIIDPDLAISRLQDSEPELLIFLKTHGINRDDLIDAFRLYKCYRSLLAPTENVPRVDFAHLQQAAYQVLLGSEEATHSFKYVIVDEYQDTNTIQEKIFFRLAQANHNICVVGDDDQALYRFRGATVENFVNFPQRCQKYLGDPPKTIPLSINYRSPKGIVDFYTRYINQENWKRKEGGFFRVIDKEICAAQSHEGPSVVASSPLEPESACDEIAEFVHSLISQNKVQDPNQIAFLFPSLKSTYVNTMSSALEQKGLSVYAPRANTFLYTQEAKDIFGMLTLILGKPDMRGQGFGGDFDKFRDWIYLTQDNAQKIADQDPQLTQFINDKHNEIDRVCSDYQSLISVVERENWDLTSNYSPEIMTRKLYNASGLSQAGKKLLSSRYFDTQVKNHLKRGRPYSLKYILTRTTSLDWSVLDLFYRVTGFNHFKLMVDLAQQGIDEGPICNLSLITQYLARFVESFIPLITAQALINKTFHKVFFFSYLFSLYRLRETEYEDLDDPFPKGRIPFLTIHQAKGLEFPVVVLGNPYRRRLPPDFTEIALRPFIQNQEPEPLNRIPDFDTSRMFYVALSRAEHLLLISHFRGCAVDKSLRKLLSDDLLRLPNISLRDIPSYKPKPKRDLPEMYSYTSDFLLYKICPRQYMIFRKYGFVPSRAQTMFFGSLIHQTLNDLHHELIRRREEATNQ